MKTVLVLALAVFMSACSAIMPTRDVPSEDAVGAYPAIGAVPQSPTDTLTPEERTKMTTDLESARATNKKAAAAPLPE